MQSILFVPGNRPERFAKALASGADCVCIDLEDAVPAANKASARDAALAAITDDARLALRINAVSTRAGLADILALTETGKRPSLLFLPMVEAAAEVAIVRSLLADADIGFVPLIETVAGLRNADAIAAEPNVASIMLGGADFSAQLGVTLSWEPLLFARSQLVMAAAGAGKSVIDVPYIHLDDEAGLIEEAQKAKALGFSAKAAIHPAQIAPIHSVFRPIASEIAEAKEAEDAFASANGAAVRFRGRMLEAPVMARYRQILSLKDRIDA
ncbi:MAG: HpcH/HpaI aldolase/citrate lyase family protein [Sphingorhabdus sp.]